MALKKSQSPLQSFLRDNVALLGLGALIAIIVFARKTP